MKGKKIAVALFLFGGLSFGAFAQSNSSQTAVVETNISCDTLVSPDVFYLSVTIKDDKGAGKAGIEKTEVSVFVPILKKAGIDIKKDLVVSGFSSGYNKKGNDVIASKSFQVKLTSMSQVNEITERLTKANIGDVYIAKVGVSNYEELVNLLRVKAMKQSRSEAELLTSAVGYKSGQPMRISYFGASNPLNDNFFARSNMMMKGGDAMMNSMSEDMVDAYRKIRVAATVSVSYAIVK